MWARYEQRTTERAGFSIRSLLLEKRLQAGLSVLSGFMEACVLWYGGQYVIRGEMSVGVFAGFLAIRQAVAVPLAPLPGERDRRDDAHAHEDRDDPGLPFAEGVLRGTAEVLVAKHRAGPTGMVRLAFLDHYTKFANMAKGV